MTNVIDQARQARQLVETSLRKTLCRRLKARELHGDSSCNGETVVCSFCGVTAQVQVDDLERLPQLVGARR